MGNILPYDDRDGVIWFDGSLTPWRDAKIHVLTHGLHYGSCVFEGERVYEGAIFKSRVHTERLKRSAELLGFEIPYTVEEIEAAKRETLARSGLENAYVRPVAWRGAEQMGVRAPESKIHLAIAMWDWGVYFADKLKGIRLTWADWRRPPAECAPVKAKAAGLYMICTLAKHAAEARGYNDALMLDYKGRIAECTGAHIFFLRDGELHTPTNDILLDGITRATVLELAEARRMRVHARDIMPDELRTFSDCFIVGSAAEITPVREIAGQAFAVSDVTRTLIDDYDRLVRRQLALKAAE